MCSFACCNIFFLDSVSLCTPAPLLYYFSDWERFSRLICICTFAFTLASTHFNCCWSLTSSKWLLLFVPVLLMLLLIVLAASLTAISLHFRFPHLHIFRLPTALHINSSQTQVKSFDRAECVSLCLIGLTCVVQHWSHQHHFCLSLWTLDTHANKCCWS